MDEASTLNRPLEDINQEDKESLGRANQVVLTNINQDKMRNQTKSLLPQKGRRNGGTVQED